MSVNIQLIGGGFRNKGAEMMLVATRDAIASRIPYASFSLPLGKHSLRNMESFGRVALLTSERLQALQPVCDSVARITPRMIRKSIRLSRLTELSATLDLSGFKYSDQCGPEAGEVMAEVADRLAGAGQPLVMLPQAFGPFERPDVRALSKRIIDSATLVFARDAVSYEYLVDLVGSSSKIRQAPDFTMSLVPGDLGKSPLGVAGAAGIIPNYKMITQRRSRELGEYFSFLREVVRGVSAMKLQVAWIIHEPGRDEDVALRVRESLGDSTSPVIVEPDVRRLKAIIGQLAFVVGSRYHGLVSALAQGVPAIGAGWSHKYDALFEDFGCPELLLDDVSSMGRLQELMAIVADPQHCRELQTRIGIAANRLQARTEEMWNETVQAISRSSYAVSKAV